MKTITSSLISLAMIFIFASAAYPGSENSIYPKPSAAAIHYIVTVNMSIDQPVCGNYYIMMTDAAGKTVAQPQLFIEGVTEYVFSETGRDFVGIRTAKMVVAPFMDDPVCDQLISTEPDSRFTYYVTGETYPFELYPKFGLPD